MNIDPLINWGLNMLTLLQKCKLIKAEEEAKLLAGDSKPLDPEVKPRLIAGVTPQRIIDVMGWLEKYEAPLREWAEWMKLIKTTQDTIRTQGYTRETPQLLDQRIQRPLQFRSSDEVASLLQSFVLATSKSLKWGFRIPGSSEILESIFGKLKALERQQAKGGFTGLVLALGTIVGDVTATLPNVFNDMMERVSTKNVMNWVRKKLGITTSAQRQMATIAIQK